MRTNVDFDRPPFGQQELVCEGSPFHEASTAEQRSIAIHMCRSHCEVLAQCFVWARGKRWNGVVVAGISYREGTQRGDRPMGPGQQPRPSRNGCPICRRPQ